MLRMDLEQLILKYDNELIRLVATRKIPRIETPGLILEEVSEGKEITTYFWIARELVKSGLARYLEETISNSEWMQIHFKERINPAGPPSPLPEDFYSAVYQTFTQIKDEEKIKNSHRMRARYREILESRIGRINRLASAEAISLTRVLTKEENDLYDNIHQMVKSWREKMRKIGEK
jgi:hypothetical protein